MLYHQAIPALQHRHFQPAFNQSKYQTQYQTFTPQINIYRPNSLSLEAAYSGHRAPWFWFLQSQAAMQKSKSQQKIGPVGSDFFFEADETNYVFKTKDLLMQVHFRSAIKEISQYLEQYEKYNFLSEISSVGIKASQERLYYEQINQLIQKDFYKYLEKTTRYIQQMVMNIQMMKSERWHYYAQLVRLYKNHLLRKDLDCYSFNLGQFADHRHKVEQHLRDMSTETDAQTVKTIKEQIRANRKLISEKLNQIHDNMFVKNPFKAQNNKLKELESSQLFASYMKKVAYSTDSLQSSLEFKFYDCLGKISQFFVSLKDISLEGQKIAVEIINDYNDCSHENINQIQKPKINYSNSKQVDMNEHCAEWRKHMKSHPILVNKVERIEVCNRILIKDEGQGLVSTYFNDSEAKILIPYDQEEFNNNRIPCNNPYVDYWSLVYDRDKLMKLQIYMELPIRKQPPQKNRISDFVQDNFNKIAKNRASKTPIIKDNVYYESICHRRGQQESTLKCEALKNEKQAKSYETHGLYARKGNMSHFSIAAEEQQENQNKLQKLENRIKVYKQMSENQKRLEEDFFPLKYYKDYRQFAVKFGLENTREDLSGATMSRYGIEIQKNINLNNNIVKLEQFLCFCLKQKIFRQIPGYNDKASMPLIFNPKPAAEFCDWRIVKKLGQLTQTYKRYYIWASQVIKYEQIVSIKKKAICNFTIYAYSTPENGRRMLFELKRRLNAKVTGEVIESYGFGSTPYQDSALSKLQLLHRLIFNQHAETPTAQLSAEKGRQLFNSIVRGSTNSKQ